MKNCKWILEDEDRLGYLAKCKNIMFYLAYGDIEENEMKFCPFCGKLIKEINNEN